ncbi:hypothetical protein GMJLKIPL_5727 [Methylobacterium isbiliense]|uniref:Uncharacterized protein n=1 Tax=Methylobacterium isbiliense TaxID=315478 RepID=A0ABQ4SPJ5_9HYPH|nr:hypothetical protein GMJLKIPL_5727 [Methylobacterium isbiliense]
MAPNITSAANRIGTEASQKPSTATQAAAISAALRRRVSHALSCRSASSPPSPERRKNGAMNAAPASVTRAADPPSTPPPAPPTPNRIRNTSAFLRKLSLKAEKNWHQNSGAKRRVVISDPDMVFLTPRRWRDAAQGRHRNR